MARNEMQQAAFENPGKEAVKANPPKSYVMYQKGDKTYTAILTLDNLSDHQDNGELRGWHWHASVARWAGPKHVKCNEHRQLVEVGRIVDRVFEGIGEGKKRRIRPDYRSALDRKCVHYFKKLTEAEVEELTESLV